MKMTVALSWVVWVAATHTTSLGQSAQPDISLVRLSSDPVNLDNISSPSTNIVMKCRFEKLNEFCWFINSDSFPRAPTMEKPSADFTFVIVYAHQLFDELDGVSTLSVKAAGLVGVRNITCGSLEVRSTPIYTNFSFPWFETHKWILTVSVTIFFASLGFFLCLYHFKKDNSDLKVNFKEKNRIGIGAFGSVWKGTYKGSPVAVKYLKFHVRELIGGGALKQILGGGADRLGAGESTQKDVRKFLDECNQLNRLSHDNIVRHIATLIDNSDFPVCVMELMDCSLKIYLKNRVGRKLSLDSQVSLCTDICKGLEYLRKDELVHRDLCADNVLLALTNPPKAKIADFGLSKLLCGDFSVTLSVFTKREAYIAPEAFKTPYHYEYSLDMYAFGVLAAQIVQVNCMMYKKSDLFKTLTEIPHNHQMSSFIQLCLSHDRKQRPEAANAVMYLNLIRTHLNNN